MRDLRIWGWLGALLLAGCGGDGGDGDTGDKPGTTDTDTDPDTDTVTDTDTETAPTREGLLQRVGAATVTGGTYAGSEDLELVADDGYGDVVCRIHYDLASIAVRDDCSVCTWAFDLQISNATVAEDPLGACKVGAGYDASDVATLDGTVTSRGYDPVYAGHAEVLMSELDPGTWQSVTYATFDDATGALSYEWEDGIVAY